MEITFASLVGVEHIPFAELLAKAAERNLTGIEVNCGPTYAPIAGADFGGHLDIDAVLRDGPTATHELLAVHGATITAIAPMLNLLTPDTSLREERIAYFRRAIDAAVALGVSTVVTYGGSAYGMHFWGLPGVGDGHPSSRVADNLAAYRTVWEPLAAYAEECGIRVAFETAARGGGEGNIAHGPALWDMIFDAVPSPALGLSFDPSHLVWLHIPNVPDVVRAYGERIYHVDGKDAEILPAVLAKQGIFGSGWWRYRLPGLGALDWKAIFSALGDVGYDGPVSIENEDPLCLGLDGVAWSANYLRAQLLPRGW